MPTAPKNGYYLYHYKRTDLLVSIRRVYHQKPFTPIFGENLAHNLESILAASPARLQIVLSHAGYAAQGLVLSVCVWDRGSSVECVVFSV